jgi:UDP-N-acetylmuramyl pentapeptide phosphotransferase/UDP-N-acetylglucosamine-1-phosphate transferase
MIRLIAAAVVAGVTTAVLMPFVRRLAIRHGYMDVPNEQSSHQRPTPRVGGYSMLAGVVAALFVVGAWRETTVATIMTGALVLGVAAFVDDRRALPRLVRLGVQFGVAALVLWSLQTSSLLLSIGALVWIVAVINAYNFMDGLNGIAGIGALVTASALAVLALRHGNAAPAALAVSVAAAAAGFLPFNLFSGSVFMGDAGSTALGFVFASLAIDAATWGGASVAAMLPLAPFVLDAWMTIMRRALQGERFFSTRHRTSFYQLLQQSGWSHQEVAGFYGVLTLISAGVALAFDDLSPMRQGLALAALASGHAVIFFFIARKFHAARLLREG